MRVGIVSDFTVVRNNTTQNKKVKSNNQVLVNVPNVVAFTSREKNMRQLASFTPENNGLGLPEAAQGGEGCVGYEAVDSLRKHENIDARSFMPFWEHNNPKGGYKFLIHREKDFPNGVSSLPNEMPASAFYSANVGETLETVAQKNTVY
jgi:hypothetical protein